MRQLRWTCIPVLAVALTASCDRASSPGDKGPRRVMAEVSAPVAQVGARAKPAMAAPAVADAVGNEAGAATVPAYDSTSMLIRTASADVEVHALDTAVVAARRMASRWGGVVANTQMSTGRNEVHRAVIQIKVPAARFDSLIGGLAPLGRLESVSVNAEDVGQEYVDIEARLANLRRLEARLVELLANRTGKLSDVLMVERELARVRGEIDQIEGRRRFLQRSVALSTLELTLHEPEPVLAGTPGSNPITEAFRNAWRNFVGSVAWCIAALGVLIPIGVFVGAIAWLVWWGKRRFPGFGAPA